MASDDSEIDQNLGEDAAEQVLGEESYETPTPSSPDTLVTSSVSCASQELGILWGDYEMPCCRGMPQLTLALIKPDGMKYFKRIYKRIRDEGFDVVRARKVLLSPEQASDFYYEHYGKPYFPVLVASMIEGPVQVFVLRRKDAVPMWKLTCGPPCVDQAKKMWPDSLRALYGTGGKVFKNVCHGSATEEKAREEIRFFFPNMIQDENFLNTVDAEEYLKERVNPTLLEGLTQLCKNKPLDPLLWLSTWLLVNNPNKPKLAESIALTPT